MPPIRKTKNKPISTMNENNYSLPENSKRKILWKNEMPSVESGSGDIIEPFNQEPYQAVSKELETREKKIMDNTTAIGKSKDMVTRSFSSQYANRKELIDKLLTNMEYLTTQYEKDLCLIRDDTNKLEVFMSQAIKSSNHAIKTLECRFAGFKELFKTFEDSWKLLEEEQKAQELDLAQNVLENTLMLIKNPVKNARNEKYTSS